MFGAFNFNPDECVDGSRRRASSSAERTDASALLARRPVVRLALPRRRPCDRSREGVTPSSNGWSTHREDTRASGDLPAPAEDH